MSLKLCFLCARAWLAVALLVGSVTPGLAVPASAQTTDLRDAAGEVGALLSIAAGEYELAASVHGRLQDGLQLAVGRPERETTTLADFLAAMVIIVREGVEAALIIAALLAFLVRSGNALHRQAVYWGAAAAVGSSLLTALALELALAVAPASQEVLEGVTMLVAVAVLFSVSYWLVSKVEHKRWERYIRDKVELALSKRSRFALASVAFLAVYREGFETVLFYKALMGAANSSAAVFGGFALGVLALAVFCLLIYRFGARIPLRNFFALTSAVLYYMAFVFAGQGIHELQEAGVVSATWAAGAPRVDFLGLYPTAEGLAVQGLLVLALVLALVWTFVIAPARARVEQAPPP